VDQKWKKKKTFATYNICYYTKRPRPAMLPYINNEWTILFYNSPIFDIYFINIPPSTLSLCAS
jgi:hypothetical protein